MRHSIFRITTVVALLMLLIAPALSVNAYAFSPDTNLSTADASFGGENANDFSGYSVAPAGDVNGDGYDDFLIGAYDTTAGGNNDSGRTYLILGKASGWTTDFELEDAIASFDGENANDESGRTVAAAGDVNDDDYDDFLIGAANNADGGAGAGKVYLILGRPVANWGFGFSLANADASFRGETAGDNAGAAIAGGGDINNDGYDDFLIGAPNNADGGANAGKIYVFQGKAIPDWGQGKLLSEADGSFVGETAGDNAGSALAIAGDVNNDGRSDFLIGAHRWDNGGDADVGKTYLILGKPAIDWGPSLALDDVLITISFIGEAGSDGAGYSVSSAGDVNNDNYDDFLIAAYKNDAGGVDAGQTYLILGKETPDWGLLKSLEEADASFWGEEDLDEFGVSVASVGNVNGDVYDDFIIGANKYNAGANNDAGKTYLIFGKASGWAMDVDFATTAPDASFLGENQADTSGQSIAGAGDVNGDGANDILIGAPNHNFSNAGAGKTYLIFGNTAPNAPTSPTCEELTNPTNISDLTPEFGWTFSDSNAPDTQSAYQILVASSSANLTADTGDLWDSGKVVSAASADIAYAGATLPWGSTMYWKVRAWDNHDAVGAYCAEQTFAMQVVPNAPTTPLCENATNPTGVSDITPEFGWTFSDANDPDNQSAYQILVASTSANLTANTGDLWDSGKVASISSTAVPYAGTSLADTWGSTIYWKVKTWDSSDAPGLYCAEQTFVMQVGPTAPVDPLCENEENPTGVRDLMPEFSWTFADPSTPDNQSAYQILVASTSEKLTANDGDLWDSGVVASVSSSGIPYAGTSLDGSWGTTYYWKVKTWDDLGAEGVYCAEQTFTMQVGPIAPETPLCEEQTNPTGVRDPEPKFGWTFSDPDDPDNQSAYQILVASSSANLAANTGDLWDSGVVASVSSTSVSYDGDELSYGTTYYWKVKTWDDLGAEGVYCAQQTFTMQMIPNAPIEAECEGAANPEALADTIPEFTWTFSDADGTDSQSAYQILVASTPENLAADTGDVWDSGKQQSTISGTTYAGTALSHGATYYWKVKTWDNLDAEGIYSAEQTFTLKSVILPFWAEIAIAAAGAAIIAAALMWLLVGRKSSPAA